MQFFTDPEARLDSRFDVGSRVGNKYLCVIVKAKQGDAFVRTAYLTDRIKRGVQRWPNES